MTLGLDQHADTLARRRRTAERCGRPAVLHCAELESGGRERGARISVGCALVRGGGRGSKLDEAERLKDRTASRGGVDLEIAKPSR